MDNRESLLIWKELRNEIRNLIKEELKGYVKWIPMKVVSANNTNKTATVRPIYGNIDGSEDYKNVPNTSGVNLSVDDTVYIAYAYNPTNAIIIFKAH